MRRLIQNSLEKWVKSSIRKPMILRGARQVGKTYTVRELGKQFKSFVEINLELHPITEKIFQEDLDPNRIIQELSILSGRKIIPGETLLFIDEIQTYPKAITALRYFYELMPKLHVIAAGSLFDFALEKTGIPVGRVEQLYLHPISFIEFLLANNKNLIVEQIFSKQTNDLKPVSELIHKNILKSLTEYFAIGGMPEAVSCWVNTKDPIECFNIHDNLIENYKQDFSKYTKKHQLKLIEPLFKYIPQQFGTKFKFSKIPGEFRKRDLNPCLDLLETAGVITKVTQTNGNGSPLGAEAKPDNFKVIFLDIALSQTLLNLDKGQWILQPENNFINQGMLTEAFVGQELLSYSSYSKKKSLYYWQRDAKNSSAEVDYLTQINNKIIPIEVKSKLGSTLRSIKSFLESHNNNISPYGIRFSQHNYSMHENVKSYPLYAIASSLNFNI